ncbi:hypothetical protein D9758_001445 [Tetrapyrgos nigripes]|uniref:MFS general substrate transporter n=1 Tax=Tetrapyrgos nigripes TaxID=182062 RepID=A0A8H5GYA5_9AGAR|nr:hypothetical protein D9758_001445 [Tetrapyrgos nigripes]
MAPEIKSANHAQTASPASAETTGATSLKAQWRRSWLHFFACCSSLFTIGWVDGSSGPLIPLMQEQFRVNYTLVSLIFIVNAIGCLTAAAINVYFSGKLAFGKAIVAGTVTLALTQIRHPITFGATAQTIANAIQSSGIRLPFGVFVFSYYITGFGVAMQDGQANGYMTGVKRNGATKMGVMHAAYGAGAFAAPLISTQFSRHPSFWSYFYIVSAGIGILNVTCLIGTFRFKGREECLAEEGEGVGQTAELDTLRDADGGQDTSQTEEVHYKQILKSRAVLLISVFLLSYVGVEVTQGNWSVSYIISQRNGGSASGYVSAGFFGGLTVGPFQLIVWLVPSLITGALFISFIGVFLGPLFPIAMNVCGRTLPPHILTGSIGLTTAFSATGAAIIPFITGAIAQGAGIWSLQPL